MQEIFQEKVIERPTSATAGATRALKASGATRAPGLLVQNIASKVCKARSVQLNILHMDIYANVSRANKIMMIMVIRMMMSGREKQHVENGEAWKAVSLGQIGPETECVGTSL